MTKLFHAGGAFLSADIFRMRLASVNATYGRIPFRMSGEVALEAHAAYQMPKWSPVRVCV